jgi:uncharacterized protein (TIGR03083 family)
MSEPIVDLLDEAWTSISELCGELDEAMWDLPTDLPGWSVKDNLSHIVGTERTMRGDDAPDIDVSGVAHVRNPVGAMNEMWIESLRPCTGAEVLAAFDQLRAERIAELRGLPRERFDEEGWTPAGQAPYREFLRIRAFDSWMHEQDIRRATGRPGHLSGPVADHALDRCALAMGFVVGKRAGAPDGTSVRFDITGEAGRTIVVVVEGRARLVDADEAPDPPTVRLTTDVETYCCLGGGRWDPDRVLSDGGITIEGDRDLGESVVRSLNFMI